MHWTKSLQTPIGIALVFLFAAVYVHQEPKSCPTPLSRLDLLHAMFSHGTMRIDAYDNTPDKSSWQGHYYSDKAPGTTALAIPAFALGAGGLKTAGVGLDTPSGWLVSSWIACAGSVAIAAALGAALLFAWLLNYVPPRAALVATLGIFLGAAPLPYATMLFSHSLVVGCVAIALYAIQRGTVTASGAAPASSRPWDLLAGFVCGWAVASEYTVGLIIGGLFIWLISHGWRRAIPFCLAAIPPLLLIPLYSWLCFGNPLLLPYSLNESFPAMREGLYAIKLPDLDTGYNLLFSPTRGLFFWTPFLLMALVGYWDLIRTHPRLFWLTYALPLLQVVVISGRVWDWQAGPTLGPRYLAPMLPLLALPCALGVKRFPRTGILLAAGSIVLTALATLTNASPPGSVYNPLTEIHLPRLLKGELQPNLGALLGLPPCGSLALFSVLLSGGIAWLWWTVSRVKIAPATDPSRAPGAPVVSLPDDVMNSNKG